VKLHKIVWKFKLIAVQGHPRSSILVSIERAYYWSLIVTLDTRISDSCRFRDIDAFSSSALSHLTLNINAKVIDASNDHFVNMSILNTITQQTKRPQHRIQFTIWNYISAAWSRMYLLGLRQQPFLSRPLNQISRLRTFFRNLRLQGNAQRALDTHELLQVRLVATCAGSSHFLLNSSFAWAKNALTAT